MIKNNKRFMILFSILITMTLLSTVGCQSYKKYNKPYGADSLVHEGHHRAWEIFIPENMEKNVPLVIDMHGYNGTAYSQRGASGFRELAKEENFIVAWPYGLYRSWNSGKECCDPAVKDNIDDVGFLRKMIDQIAEKHPVDRTRVYVTGLSNGAAMAQRMAYEADDIIAACAAMSLYLIAPENPDYSPIPIMELHGTKDGVVSYGNGYFPGAMENFKKWQTLNLCEGEALETWRDGKSYALLATGAEGSAEVALVTIEGAGHILYKGFSSCGVDTTQMAWDFLKRHAKEK